MGKANLESINKTNFANLKSMKYLTLSTNDISFIEDNSFSDMTNLLNLDLFENNLKSIGKKTFHGLLNLDYLRLELNKLTMICNDTFEYLTKLRYLMLNDNKLEIIERGAFNNLISLKSLRLQNNKIKYFEKDTLQDLISLETFDMFDNLIEAIDQNFFVKNTNLKYLILFGNKLTENLFSFNLNSNVQISLTSNQIKHFEISNLTCGLDGKINEINLNRNLIQTLDRKSFKGFECLNRLSHLDISQNRIINIEEGTFLNFVNLKSLNLSMNWIELKAFTFSELLGLEILDLSSNGIKFLSETQFANCLKLKRLILSQNQIKEINNQSLFSLNLLEYLDLESNLINKIEASSFNSLVNMKELNLRSNNLTSMANLLKSSIPKRLNNLELIDLSNNFIEYFDLLDFKYQFEKVKTVNLNENMLKNFSNIFLENIAILKFRKTKINPLRFEHIFSERKINYLQELDLSFNNVSFESAENVSLENLLTLNLRSTCLTNVSTILGLVNEKLTNLDLSDNLLFSNESHATFFRPLKELKVLELKNVSLDDLEKIFLNPRLVKIDLSFNRLTFLKKIVFGAQLLLIDKYC
jgi:Leucine-rich repeat (LRR) protein